MLSQNVLSMTTDDMELAARQGDRDAMVELIRRSGSEKTRLQWTKELVQHDLGKMRAKGVRFVTPSAGKDVAIRLCPACAVQHHRKVRIEDALTACFPPGCRCEVKGALVPLPEIDGMVHLDGKEEAPSPMEVRATKTGPTAEDLGRTYWRIIFGILGLAIIAFAWWTSTWPTVEQQMAKQEAARAAEAANVRARLEAAGHGAAKVMPDQAFDTCVRYLKQFSKDPEHIGIPRVGWMTGGINWRFAWGDYTKFLRMRNGLGLEVAARGVCVVDEVTGLPMLLVVDGQELIGPHSLKVEANPSN